MPLSLRNVLPSMAIVLAATASIARAVMVATVVPYSLGNTIDSDGDGVPDLTDNAPGTFNPAQNDTDADGIGDVIDPTVTSANPNLGDPGLGLFHPSPITAGSHAIIDYQLVAKPPGGWGRIALDLNNDNAIDAFYFGPLDMPGTFSMDIAPSLFTNAGWDLNTPGSYTFQAKAIGPGRSSDIFRLRH